MDAFYTTATIYINRLRDKIIEYADRNGEYPKCILASMKAYCLLEHYARDFCAVKTGSGFIVQFHGIEVRAVSGDGYDIFLSGAPITLRE